MALQVSQGVTTTAAAPTPLTPSASETIGSGSFGQQGVYIRVITTGTATTVATLDPGATGIGNPGTVTGQVMPATGSRVWLIPVGAINTTTGVATITFTSITGATYELWRA